MKKSALQGEIQRSKPFEVLEEEVFLNLIRTAGQLTGRTAPLFKTEKISAPLYNILRILRGAGEEGLPSLEIARRMVTRVPDITRLVDRLEQQGLAVRERIDQDRRVVMVKITLKGSGIVDRLEKPLQELHRKNLSGLEADELKSLNHLLVLARSGLREGEESL